MKYTEYMNKYFCLWFERKQKKLEDKYYNYLLKNNPEDMLLDDNLEEIYDTEEFELWLEEKFLVDNFVAWVQVRNR